MNREPYLLQEMSSSCAKYVSQISTNTTTYHHGRFLMITPRCESLERIIISFQTAKLCKTHSPQHPTHVRMCLVKHGIYHSVYEIAHAQRPGFPLLSQDSWRGELRFFFFCSGSSPLCVELIKL